MHTRDNNIKSSYVFSRTFGFDSNRKEQWKRRRPIETNQTTMGWSGERHQAQATILRFRFYPRIEYAVFSLRDIHIFRCLVGGNHFRRSLGLVVFRPVPTSIIVVCRPGDIKIITFCLRVSAEKTQKSIGISETLVATSVSGIIFSLFSGQPLLIVGTTGPLLLFDDALYKVIVILSSTILHNLAVIGPIFCV